MKGPPLTEPVLPTVNEALTRAAQSRFGLVFLDAREREERVSWAEIHERAQCMAAALLDHGVLAGDRVAMVLPTGLDFMDAFFGTLYAGAVPVPLYPPARLGRMEEYVVSTGHLIDVVGERLVLSSLRALLLVRRV